MQIGTCWFNAQEQVLVDAASGRSWLLSADEFQALSLLSAQRGKVVSRMELLQVISPHLKLSMRADELLNSTIRRLRLFLGDDAAHLLVSIANQGYILYATPRKHSRTALNSPLFKLSMPQFIVLTLLTLAALLWVGSHITHPTSIAPNYAKQLLTHDGHYSEIQFYTGQPSDHSMRPLVDHFLEQVSACAVFPWQSIAATISADQRFVSLVLKNNDANGLEFETIKMMSENFNVDVIDELWLKMVGICA
ncbi:winged helix-turn-helix domain-containing protein [Shewanella seohaensis]|uniref:Transcriptional regulator n=1 Tax=Shewanella seohaensis TaxID=755175 RepID=A0ABV4VUP3_9GAMM